MHIKLLIVSLQQNMSYDISESVSQRGSGEETTENRRIHEIADELHRRCQLYEAQLRNGQSDVNHLEVEQRVAELYAKENGMWLPMSNIGFTRQNDEGRYANADFVVWDLVPRNVLRDNDGDIFIIDAEIARNQ